MVFLALPVVLLVVLMMDNLLEFLDMWMMLLLLFMLDFSSPMNEKLARKSQYRMAQTSAKRISTMSSFIEWYY